MDIYTPSIDVQKWFPDKSDLTKWVYDIIKYLNDTPIPTEEDVAKAVDAYLAENPITGNFYSADNPPPYPVTSVNGKTGAVTIDVDTSGLYSPTDLSRCLIHRRLFLGNDCCHPFYNEQYLLLPHQAQFYCKQTSRWIVRYLLSNAERKDDMRN